MPEPYRDISVKYTWKSLPKDTYDNIFKFE